MKKKLTSLLLLVLTACLLCLPVSAIVTGSAGYAYDAAGVFTEEELETLDSRAADLADTYGLGVYLVVLDDFTQYSAEEDPYEAAKDIYLSNGWGLGEDDSGVMLMLSMATRKYAFIAHGYGNTVYTDFGRDALKEEFLDNFGDDDWYGGFTAFLDGSEEYMRLAAEGTPFDADSVPVDGFHRLLGVLTCVLGALVIALIVTSAFRSQLHSVAERVEAQEYVTEGGVDLRVSQDSFRMITQTRTYSPKSDNRDGTTVDSDGFSGDSGDF